MENELTHHQSLANNVVRTTTGFERNPRSKLMEENGEISKSQETPVITEEDESEELLKDAERHAVRQKLAARIWKKYFDAKKSKGEKVSQEELDYARKAIEKGRPPIQGGSGDGYFEKLNAEAYRGTSVADVARRLKEAGLNGEVTNELLQSLVAEAREKAISSVDQDQCNNFVREVEGIAQRKIIDEQAEQSQEEDGNLTEAQKRARNVAQEPVRTRTIEELLQSRVNASLEKKEGRSSNPRSIQEVALSIINDEGPDRWGPNGTYPLVELIYDENGEPKYKTNYKGEKTPDPQIKLNEKNFVRWFRERMMYHHISNSRDESLQLGNLVGITSEFGSTINIFSMDKDRAQYFLDESTGTVMDKLANQLKMELWLFGNMRNYDLLYQKYMTSDSDLPKFLSQLHDKEEITQPQSLETIMTLPKDFGEDGDTSVGDGIRKAYEIYYYASDYNMLKKVLGADSVFFKREGFENALRIIEGLNPTDAISESSQKIIDSVFDGENVKPEKFIKLMNPFNEKNKPEFTKKLIREMVKQVISKKYGIEYGLTEMKVVDGKFDKEDVKERDLVRKDLEYAEAFAWVLTHWTGAAARNDTGAIGFDALTKTMKLREYRKGQSGVNRAAPFGNEYDLGVFKGLAVDFFNGVTVEKKLEDKGYNYTPFEIFRIMSDIEDDPSLSEDEKKRQKGIWSKRLNFEQYIQRSYSADHINRAFEVFQATIGAEEMRLEEIVKWDPFRGIILDRGKFEEQVKEKFLKPIRYAYRTYQQLDMGKMQRLQIGGFGPNDLPVYKDATTAETLFGPEVLRDIRPMAQNRYKNWDNAMKSQFEDRLKQKGVDFGSLSEDEKKQQIWQDYLSSQDGKDILWKRAAMAKIAAHIKSHREFGNGYTQFTAGMVEAFYEALESIKAMEIEEGEDDTDLSYAKRFFSKADIDWIRRRSGTTAGKLFMTDIMLKGVGWGATKGMWEGAGVIIKDIFK